MRGALVIWAVFFACLATGAHAARPLVPAKVAAAMLTGRWACWAETHRYAPHASGTWREWICTAVPRGVR